MFRQTDKDNNQPAEPVAIATYDSAMEADFTRSILESYGIESVVSSKKVTKNPVLSMSTPYRDKYEVCVKQEDFEQARKILEKENEEIETDESGA